MLQDQIVAVAVAIRIRLSWEATLLVGVAVADLLVGACNLSCFVGGLWQGPGLFNRTCHTCLPATARFGVLESRVATDQQIE